jgi:uncharacterized damage-inducible protein DinB
MPGDDHKATLQLYLQHGRDVLIWKLSDLPEYEVRRPLVRSGTNLLGLVKHVASVEAGYLGDVFGRPFPERLPWYEEGAEANADMWATAEEARGDIFGLYRRVWEHSDATIGALALDDTGAVPWWPPERRQATLQRVLVHVIAETHRHAGHADIVRELIDGSVGLREGNASMPPADQAWWEDYHQRLERAAAQAGRTRPEA